MRAGDDEDDLEGMEIEFRRRPRSISILEREREIKKNLVAIKSRVQRYLSFTHGKAVKRNQ